MSGHGVIQWKTREQTVGPSDTIHTPADAVEHHATS
jgi:hypothetical protein